MRIFVPKSLVLLILLTVASFALFRPSSGSSSGQEPQIQKAHLICCNSLISVPGTWIGADRNCTDYLQNAPESVREDVCKQLNDLSAFGGAACRAAMAPSCPSAKPPDTKCEPPPPPWFTPAPECKDVQEAQISQDRRGVVVYLCGYPIFTYRDKNVPSDQLFTDAYQAALRDKFKASVGKVCCDSFRLALRTGLPCNPRSDVDCDGKPNQADADGSIPDFDGRGFRVPEGAEFDDFPSGMTEDEIMPPESQCQGCKWELISGQLKCSPDGRQRHVYEAKWRCPSTKVEVNKFHYAPASSPCTSPNRPAPSN